MIVVAVAAVINKTFFTNKISFALCRFLNGKSTPHLSTKMMKRFKGLLKDVQENYC